MTELDRRRFLQIAGGTAAFAMLNESIAKAAAIPAQGSTGTIQDIEHVVVLMQENRSFDHYFGAMKGVRGFGDPRPVLQDNGRSIFHQSDGTKDVLPFNPKVADLGMQFLEGLNHDWAGGHQAYNNGKYDKWIPAKTATTMSYMTRNDIPFHYALADAFTVCDAYHCSMIGATDPNRYYLWSGHTGNDGTGGGPVLGNQEAGYSWKTYPERLESAGVSWKVYQDMGDGLDAAGSGAGSTTPSAATTATTPCCTSTTTATPSPAAPCTRGPAPAPTSRRAAPTSTCCGRTPSTAHSRRSPGSPPPRPSANTPTGPRTSVPGTSHRSWTL